MVEEKKDIRIGALSKLFLKEALVWKMNGMMANFSHILLRLPTTNAYSSRDHFEGTDPFKVQFSFLLFYFKGG